jgi:hypothetical protein
MRKLILLAMVIGLLMGGCSSVQWHTRLQTGYFDKDGKKAGYSGSWPCVKQAMKETGRSTVYEHCNTDPKCKELAETCMKEKGYIEAKTFETTEERMALYQKAYEEGWIKPGMSRLEVIDLLGAPQIATVQLIPPRKIWMYCRSAAKTAFVGFNFILQIAWYEDKVESVDRKFKI